MTTIAGSVGIHGKLAQQANDNIERSPVEKASTSDRKFRDDFAFDMKELNPIPDPAQKEPPSAPTATNSMVFEDHHQVTGKPKPAGNKTETALLWFAKEPNWPDHCQT